MKFRAILFGTLAATSVAAHAAVITLGAIADTKVLSIFPTQASGTDFLSTYNDTGNIQRTLIKFDYSTLIGATVTSATLRLNGKSFSGSTAATSIDVFRCTRDWVEQTATWNTIDGTTAWTNLGGDAVGTSGTQLTNPFGHWAGNATNTATWYETDITTLVQGGVSATFANQGFLLTSPAGSQLTYTSREGASGSGGIDPNTPQLVVNYTPVPEPASLAALAIGTLAVVRKRRSRSK